MPFDYYEFTAKHHQTILAHSECISSRMQLECSWNTVGIFKNAVNVENALRMPYECSWIAARISWNNACRFCQSPVTLVPE